MSKGAKLETDRGQGEHSTNSVDTSSKRVPKPILPDELDLTHYRELLARGPHHLEIGDVLSTQSFRIVPLETGEIVNVPRPPQQAVVVGGGSDRYGRKWVTITGKDMKDRKIPYNLFEKDPDTDEYLGFSIFRPRFGVPMT